MKTELMNIPNKGICIVISDFSDNALEKLNLLNSNIALASKFNDIATIADCLRHDQKIAAIKEVRFQTGWGLKEAKKYIDKYMPMGVEHSPRACQGYAKRFVTDHTEPDFISNDEFNL